MAKVATHPPIRNQLLAVLPQTEFKRLKEVLHEPYRPIPHVYFPENGLITKIVATEDGASVEVGRAGREGMREICTFLGSDMVPFKAAVPLADEGRCVPSRDPAKWIVDYFKKNGSSSLSPGLIPASAAGEPATISCTRTPVFWDSLWRRARGSKMTASCPATPR